MKKSTLLVSLAALIGALVIGISARAAAPDQTSTAVKGEVLDLNCYLGMGAHGQDHAMCARQCLQEGAPAGLLAEDGSVYLLAGHSKAYTQVRKMAAQTVTVTGKKVSRGNITAILVDKVEKAK